MRRTKPVIFLSHSGGTEFIDALTRSLPDCELLISDFRDQSGGILASKVQCDIRRADLLVLLFTENAVLSPWVHQEVGFACALEKKIIPVADVQLPAMLQGLEWEPYDPQRVEVVAMRTAMRIGALMREEFTRVFDTLLSYHQWWAMMNEGRFTDEPCIATSPHDIWPWLMPQERLKRRVVYRHLIRGDFDFDRRTVALHSANGEEAVCAVGELADFEEVTVCGSVVVDTLLEHRFATDVDSFLRVSRTPEELVNWHAQASRRRTRIDVRVAYDERRSAALRERFEHLFALHDKPRS
jgi:hypothetical protein